MTMYWSFSDTCGSLRYRHFMPNVMPRAPEVSRAYVRIALQSGVAPTQVLLAGTGLSQEKLAAAEFVPATALAHIFRNYARCVKHRAWPPQLGAMFNIAAHGPMGFAALSAPTLGEALDVIAQFYPSRITAIDTQVHSTDTLFVMTMRHNTPDEEFGEWLVEIIMKISETVLAAVLGHPAGQNVTISFAHTPGRDIERLRQAFDAQVVFGAPRNTISIPLAWRQLPSPLHDEVAYRANLIKCREIIAAREQSDSAAHAVRNLLYQHFDAQLLRESTASTPPTLEQIAAQLHTTPRTLIRRLAKENTSFKHLLESLRREYAEKLLRDARLNIADAADILGYSDTANFGRAFRRWYGESPAAWRKR